MLSRLLRTPRFRRTWHCAPSLHRAHSVICVAGSRGNASVTGSAALLPGFSGGNYNTAKRSSLTVSRGCSVAVAHGLVVVVKDPTAREASTRLEETRDRRPGRPIPRPTCVAARLWAGGATSSLAIGGARPLRRNSGAVCRTHAEQLQAAQASNPSAPGVAPSCSRSALQA